MTETPRGWGVTPSTGIPDRLRQPERRDRKNNGDDQQCRGAGWLLATTMFLQSIWTHKPT